LLIQECEQRACTEYKSLVESCDAALWIGENKHKGLGIFSFSGFKLKLADFYDPQFKYVVPILVDQYLVFHIWAMPDARDKRRSYVGQIWAALQHYQSYLNNKTVLAGDFNSHVLWDKERPDGNHSAVVDFLNQSDIISIYHHVNNIEQGQEPDPSIYLLKQKHKPYHLDYCFAHRSLISNNTTAEMGQHDDWIKLSDHMPLVVDGLIVSN